MTLSAIAKLTIPAAILVLAGCSPTSNFSGNGATGLGGGFAGTGGGSAGGGSGGGSGGGGGPTVTFEPIMQYGPAQTPGFGAVKVSGDAGEIVFVDDADPLGLNTNGDWQLFSLNIGTQTLTQITDGSEFALSSLEEFDLTDDGAFVVWASVNDFTGDNPSNQLNIFIASTSGAGISQVTAIDNGAAFNPQISGTATSSQLIVFLSDSDLTGDNPDEDTHIFSINVDGTNLTQLTDQAEPLSPENLSLSDDGSTIAFEGLGDPSGTNGDGSREIFVMDSNGENIIQITETAGNSLLPKLSDNGSRVVFTTMAEIFPGGNPDGNFEVYVARTDGSGITQITNADLNSGTYVDGIPGDYDISGNGAYIVFGSRDNLTGVNVFRTRPSGHRQTAPSFSSYCARARCLLTCMPTRILTPRLCQFSTTAPALSS